MEHQADIKIIKSDLVDPYEDKVVQTYDDPPEVWHKALGDNLTFNFGLFNEEELASGPKPGSIGHSEFRASHRQLDLAGLMTSHRPQIHRILDLGCGWGYITQHLLDVFEECSRIDAINISDQQLTYLAS